MWQISILKTDKGWYVKEELVDDVDLIDEVRHRHFNTFMGLVAELATLYRVNIRELIRKEKDTNVIKFLKRVK